MARHTFFCIDAHTCGNPVRVVAGGGPLLPNVPMAEKRQIFMQHHDWVRRALMFEPRGHDVMSGSILYPPTREDCELGVLYIEVSGCLPMCGHGTIGTVTVAIEEGLVQPRTPGRFAIEAPAGRVEVEYVQQGAFVEQVRLHNVPAYLHAAEVPIDVPGLGELVVDVAYGGNFYAIVEPQPNWPGLDGCSARDLIRWSPAVRQAAQGAVAPVHPEDPAHPRRHPHPVVRQAARPPGARAQRGVLRRGRDRPLALRHRLVRTHGAVGGEGAAGGGGRVHPREHHRQPVRLPGRGRSARRQPGRDPAERRGMGASDRAQHDLCRRPRPVRARLHGRVAGSLTRWTGNPSAKPSRCG